MAAACYLAGRLPGVLQWLFLLLALCLFSIRFRQIILWWSMTSRSSGMLNESLGAQWPSKQPLRRLNLYSQTYGVVEGATRWWKKEDRWQWHALNHVIRQQAVSEYRAKGINQHLEICPTIPPAITKQPTTLLQSARFLWTSTRIIVPSSPRGAIVFWLWCWAYINSQWPPRYHSWNDEPVHDDLGWHETIGMKTLEFIETNKHVSTYVYAMDEYSFVLLNWRTQDPPMQSILSISSLEHYPIHNKSPGILGYMLGCSENRL